MGATGIAKFERRLEKLESRVKRIEKELELTGIVIASFDWKEFRQRDKEILNFLLKRGREGGTTTEIATDIGLDAPETSGRTLVYTMLKRIERISKRVKGAPIVMMDRKRWFLNFEEFSFVGLGEKIGEQKTPEGPISTSENEKEEIVT